GRLRHAGSLQHLDRAQVQGPRQERQLRQRQVLPRIHQPAGRLRLRGRNGQPHHVLGQVPGEEVDSAVPLNERSYSHDPRGRPAGRPLKLQRSRSMSPRDQPPVLITIPISHYCEKARWALDRAGIRYREQAHLQVIHWLAVRRAGGGRTAPVLVLDQRVLADSAEIVDEADASAPPDRRLFPGDPDGAAEVRALQRDFDLNLGPHGRRWMYNELLGRRDLALAYGCTGVP